MKDIKYIEPIFTLRCVIPIKIKNFYKSFLNIIKFIPKIIKFSFTKLFWKGFFHYFNGTTCSEINKLVNTKITFGIGTIKCLGILYIGFTIKTKYKGHLLYYAGLYDQKILEMVFNKK